jgi:hypothetical protein
MDNLYWLIAGQILRKHGIENIRLQADIADELISTDFKLYVKGVNETKELIEKVASNAY